jgi:two-component system KDP operon response regulator KdpE
LELDLDRCKLKKEGKEIHLSRIEFRLLEYLMKHKGVALTHPTRLRAIWGPEYSHELEYLRTYIRLLRKKIEDVPAKPAYIVTENWLGYRFREPAERAIGKPGTSLTIGDSSSKQRNRSDVPVIDRTGRHGPK